MYNMQSSSILKKQKITTILMSTIITLVFCLISTNTIFADVIGENINNLGLVDTIDFNNIDNTLSHNTTIGGDYESTFGVLYPIYGIKDYYITQYDFRGGGPLLRIIDKDGYIISKGYYEIDNTLGLGDTLKVRAPEGQRESFAGIINSDFREIVPSKYVKASVVENNSVIYCTATDTYQDTYYYDLNGNKIEDINDYISQNAISQWAEESVENAINADIVPDDLQSYYTTNITREQFCELAVQTYFVLENKTADDFYTQTSPFTDTSSESVIIANQLGIVNGLGDGTFAPNNEITRQESAVMLTNLCNVLNIEITPYSDTFIDDSYFADWATDSIYYITGTLNGTTDQIMNGTDINKFSPWMNYTIEQAITTMYRIYDYNI